VKDIVLFDLLGFENDLVFSDSLLEQVAQNRLYLVLLLDVQVFSILENIGVLHHVYGHILFNERFLDMIQLAFSVGSRGHRNELGLGLRLFEFILRSYVNYFSLLLQS